MLTTTEETWRADAIGALVDPDTTEPTTTLAGAVLALLHDIDVARRTAMVEPALTRRQVAEILQVSAASVTALVDRGDLVAASIGDGTKRTFRFSRSAVAEYLTRQSTDPTRRRFEYAPRPVSA